MRKKNGFTLAELLIVVSIIAVLVSISIPIFSNQLKKARLAVVQNNIRSAMSKASAAIYDKSYDFSSVSGGLSNTKAVYFLIDANTSEVLKSDVGNWDEYNPDCVDTKYAAEAKASLKDGKYQKIAVKIPYAVIMGTEGEGGPAEHEITCCPHFSDFDGGSVWTNNGPNGVDPGFWPNR